MSIVFTAPPPRQKPTQKFERMVLQNASARPPSATTIPSEVDLNDVWHSLDKTVYDSWLCTEPEIDYESCLVLRQCQAFLDQERDRNVVQMAGSDSSNRRQYVSIKPALYAGILIGTVLGGSIVYVLMFFQSACAKRGQQHRLRRTYVIRGRREGTLLFDCWKT